MQMLTFRSFSDGLNEMMKKVYLFQLLEKGRNICLVFVIIDGEDNSRK